MKELTVEGSAARFTIAELAAALVELEGSMGAERPARVILADDSDTCLAAGLVAAKLLIPIEARPGAIEPPSANSRLIAQLAATYTAPA